MSKNDNNYTLPYSDEEKKRIIVQAEELYRGNSYINRFLHTLAQSSVNKNILDIGCGFGQMCNHIAKMSKHFHVVGIDLDEKKVSHSIKNKNYANIDYLKADAYTLPFEDNSFDLVHCRFVLMHLEEPLKAIIEMVRVLKNGGSLIVHEGIHDAVWIKKERPFTMKIFHQWKEYMMSKNQNPSIGLDLHTLFHQAGLIKTENEVIINQAKGSDSIFHTYLNNLKENLQNLSSEFKKEVKSGDYEKMKKELISHDESDYYLELTMICSGIKK